MPLTDDVKRILEAAFPKQKVYFYSSANDFKNLWTLVIEGTVVVVWDGFPSQPGGAAVDSSETLLRETDWVTPWDWAIVQSLRSEPGSTFRAMIIDTLPTSDASGGRHRFKAAHSFMPWVRWYRPGPLRSKAGDSSQPERVSYGFDDFALDLASLSTQAPHIPDKGEYAGRTNLSSLFAVWSALLESVTDRHSIANLVGPLVLSNQLCRAGTVAEDAFDTSIWNSPTRKALKQVVSAFPESGDAPFDRQNSVLPDARPLFASTDADVFGRYKRVNFLLADDQFLLGYDCVLAGLIFGDPMARSLEQDDRRWTLQCYDPSDDLRKTATNSLINGIGVSGQNSFRLLPALESCVESMESGKVHLPRMFGSCSLDVEKDSAQLDVLVLDLRLFPPSTNTAPGEMERLFFAKLAQIAVRLLQKSPLNSLLLSTLAQQAANRSLGHSVDPTVLALLPAMISTLDPSLPIVTFSSTQQRSVVAALRAYPNINTAFAKPMVSRYARNDESLTALRESLQCALVLHQRRVVWEGICATKEWEAPPTFVVDVYDLNAGRLSKPLDVRVNERDEKSGVRKISLGGDLVDDSLQSTLCRYYLRYVQGAQHDDFRALPFMFIEGRAHRIIDRKREWFNNYLKENNFGAVTSGGDNNLTITFKPKRSGLRGAIADALRLIRNRQNHAGMVDSAQDSRNADESLAGNATIALALLLLVYIKSSDSLTFVEKRDISVPTKESRESWEHFVVRTVAKSLSEASSKGYIPGSLHQWLSPLAEKVRSQPRVERNEPIQSVRTVVALDFLAKAEVFRTNGVTLHATIKRVTSQVYVVDIGIGYDALLYRNALAGLDPGLLTLGTRITVRVSKVNFFKRSIYLVPFAPI